MTQYLFYPFQYKLRSVGVLPVSSCDVCVCVAVCWLKNIRDCRVNTTLSLSVDKQGLVCDGGRRNSCGSRNAPLRGHASPTWFLRYVSLDLDGHDNWYCDATAAAAAAAAAGRAGADDDKRPTTRPRHNAFTFVGSYYHVYAKLASCRAPTGQVWGLCHYVE